MEAMVLWGNLIFLLLSKKLIKMLRDRESLKIHLKNEMCGAGKAERAERSGLPVMLSVSETSHFCTFLHMEILRLRSG
jgi:hypothetical protein